MAYTVIWHPDARAERESSWPEGEKVAMRHAAQKLEAAGPNLRAPHSSAVMGSDVPGLRELRPRAGRSRWRPLYRRATASTFLILAVAPEAQIDKRGFAAAVKRAAERNADTDFE
ncbi:MAG TPA: type II toxin-antitoxin system RelE/ParE family toxin [Solirubrobacteraceae bacterium]|nr:type II toxin-antitoxin system RelE/ParE family toxin [Solirubrobacteraceae bacterium]